MDNLIRDPDLAPKLFKLLNEKLQDTRKALELANQVRYSRLHHLYADRLEL